MDTFLLQQSALCCLSIFQRTENFKKILNFVYSVYTVDDTDKEEPFT